MPIMQLIASRPLSGKTTVAVTLARGLAAQSGVRLVRLGSGQAAEEDAVTFATDLFAGSPGRPCHIRNSRLGRPTGSVLLQKAEAEHAVLQILEQFRHLGMTQRFVGGVGHQILLRYIGDVFRVGVLSQ